MDYGVPTDTWEGKVDWWEKEFDEANEIGFCMSARNRMTGEQRRQAVRFKLEPGVPKSFYRSKARAWFEDWVTAGATPNPAAPLFDDLLEGNEVRL